MSDDKQPPSFDFGSNDEGPGQGPKAQEPATAAQSPVSGSGPAFAPSGNSDSNRSKKGCIIAAVIFLVLLLIGVIAMVSLAIWGANEISDQVEDPAFRDQIFQNEEGQSSGSITSAEFDQINNGMTYDEVVEIIGGPELSASAGGPDGSTSMVWPGESLGGAATVAFDGDKSSGTVISKSQFGL